MSRSTVRSPSSDSSRTTVDVPNECEVTATVARLRMLAEKLDDYLASPADG
ncbi:hypothetical protein Ade02nite_96110 [Paractinoplanes deccanensis]|uniref:Uncharacterized protein n=1 Tax=Paractinoplanes deccanensis TaxID=113561 RepID=A0ABQ3YMD3_9ACTN|nr:hypothetical protein [Actinoplanes deccanensis]GID80970.1 hypothetical protein Ade02nite_96110 [Actinoplanes deccanensis]